MRIIIAECQGAGGNLVASCLLDKQHTVITAVSAEALFNALEQKADLLLLDAALIEGGITDFVGQVRLLQNEIPIIIMSHNDIIHESMEALQCGAVDYLIKPFPVAMLESAISKALKKLETAKNSDVCVADATGGKPYVRLDALPSTKRHPLMKKAFGLLANVAESDITVLITGESGVGKEIIARTLHERSNRKQRNFVDLNCASVPASLLESELFGSERGSFTGSVGRRVGKFELAQQGTIFLDEVSEMEVGLQAKLLRVIQEKQFYRIGGEKKIQLDVRIVATTNRDLKDWVEQGKFRKDLYYRLNVINIHVPPLRERLEDIPILAQHIIDKFNRENKKDLSLTMEAIQQLCQYDWPGNIRELENVLFLTAFLTAGKNIDSIHFQEDSDAVVAAAVEIENSAAKSSHFGGTIEDMEREMIRQALIKFTGNRTHAANALGISVRTLRNKLRLYPEIDTLPAQQQKGIS